MMRAARGAHYGRQLFEHQKGGQRKDTKRRFHDFIRVYCGGDYSIIFDVLNTLDGRMEGGRWLNARESMMYDCQPMTRLLNGIAALMDSVPDYHKRQFASIYRDAGFTRNFLNAKGIHIGERCTRPKLLS